MELIFCSDTLDDRRSYEVPYAVAIIPIAVSGLRVPKIAAKLTKVTNLRTLYATFIFGVGPLDIVLNFGGFDVELVVVDDQGDYFHTN